jgi:MFS family permease
MFIAARFFIGFGQSFTSVATPLLMVEIIPSGRRGVIIALMGAAWYLGASKLLMGIMSELFHCISLQTFNII